MINISIIYYCNAFKYWLIYLLGQQQGDMWVTNVTTVGWQNVIPSMQVMNIQVPHPGVYPGISGSQEECNWMFSQSQRGTIGCLFEHFKWLMFKSVSRLILHLTTHTQCQHPGPVQEIVCLLWSKVESQDEEVAGDQDSAQTSNLHTFMDPNHKLSLTLTVSLWPCANIMESENFRRGILARTFSLDV